MNAKTIGTVVLLGFVAVSLAYLLVTELNADSDAPAEVTATPAGPAATADAEAADAAPATPEHKVIAYYFHNTQRCATCLKIERLAEEALREEFGAAFEDGRLEWQALDMQEPLNEAYALQYDLVTSSLVLVDLHGGEQRDWQLMDEVWQLVHDEEAAFKAYVQKQARAYLEHPA